MKAVREMKEKGEGRKEKVDSTPKWAGGGLPPMPEVKPAEAPADRQAMLDDPKLNDILGAIPGATVADIK